MSGVGNSKVEATIDTSSPVSPKNRRSLKVTVDEPAGPWASRTRDSGAFPCRKEKNTAYRSGRADGRARRLG